MRAQNDVDDPEAACGGGCIDRGKRLLPLKGKVSTPLTTLALFIAVHSVRP